MPCASALSDSRLRYRTYGNIGEGPTRGGWQANRRSPSVKQSTYVRTTVSLPSQEVKGFSQSTGTAASHHARFTTTHLKSALRSSLSHWIISHIQSCGNIL